MPYYNNYSQNQYQNPIYTPSMYPQQSYSQGYQQSYQQPQMMQQTSNTGLTWVQGEVGAKAYPVAPGSSILLMDSDDQCFYIKSADNTGMPMLKKYAYSEIVNEPMRIEQSHDNSDNFDTAVYAGREEVKQMKDEIKSLREEIENLQKAQRPSNNQQGGKKNGQQ